MDLSYTLYLPHAPPHDSPSPPTLTSLSSFTLICSTSVSYPRLYALTPSHLSSSPSLTFSLSPFSPPSHPLPYLPKSAHVTSSPTPSETTFGQIGLHFLHREVEPHRPRRLQKIEIIDRERVRETMEGGQTSM